MGLMQLMPSTARPLAKQLGVKKLQEKKLVTDPSFNVRLGKLYLEQLINRFNGSYIMAVAAYNAGPSRVRDWVTLYGDPRLPETDAIDWIENIPFNETRNYVQRVMENLQIYRSRLSEGGALIALEDDLNRPHHQLRTPILSQPQAVDAAFAAQAADVRAAAARLRGRAVVTPLLDYPSISARLGFRLLIKAETLQLTGSFKFRGAGNCLLAAKAADPALRAVVAFSSGNHAQGGCRGGPDAGPQGHDRDAVGCAGDQGRQHQGLRRRGGPLRAPPRGPRGHRPCHRGAGQGAHRAAL
jgi:hypothetical protein